jgi:chromosome segregation ATPase
MFKMEDAKIGGVTPEPIKAQAMEPIFKDPIPGVITSDELVFEIGKHVVRALNNEKFAEKVLEREKKFREHAQEAIDLLTKQVDTLPVLEKQNEGLVRSNKAYESKNHELAEALAEVRADRQEFLEKYQYAEAELKLFREESDKQKTKILLQEQSISALQSKIKNLQKKAPK